MKIITLTGRFFPNPCLFFGEIYFRNLVYMQLHKRKNNLHHLSGVF